MVSPFGPTLANIFMTEFKEVFVRLLINNGIEGKSMMHLFLLNLPILVVTSFPNLTHLTKKTRYSVVTFSDNDFHFLDI